MAFLDHNGESEFPLSKNLVFNAMIIAIPLIKGMKVEKADRLQGRILVKAGVSLFSWGESIPIQLLSVDENRTRVQITSTPKTGILFGGALDMGKNRKNIETILSQTSNVLQQSINNTESQQSTQNPQITQTLHQSLNQPKKKMGVGKKILIGIGIFFLIGIIANYDKEKTTTSDKLNTNVGLDKPKQWVEVFKIKGGDSKITASFVLTGGKTKIKYKYSVKGSGLFALYVVPDGQNIIKTGGIPDVMIQQSEDSETYIIKEAGSYYFNISSSGGKWVVSIEEEK